MACNSSGLNSNCTVSSQTAYNNTTQTVPATTTAVAIMGNLVTNTGRCITTQNGGFIIKKSGVYTIKCDITFTATAAGTETIQLYLNGVIMPCSVNSYTTTESGIVTLHTETTVYIPICCKSTSTISINVSGVAGTISHVCANALKHDPS